MKRTKEIKAGWGRLLDAWIAPDGAGAPVGCVATSYTFSPVFFEEECLGRFLQLESDPQRDGVLYLVEREEKLRQIPCAAALVDRHHCRGQRSLLWDLLPARPRAGILHAKLALMRWEQAVRLLVTSANLTESGYRNNLEVFTVLDFAPGHHGPLRCLGDCLAYLAALPTVVRAGGSDSEAARRWHGFVAGVRSAVDGWDLQETPAVGGEPAVHAILTGADRPNVFEAVGEIWPLRRLPERAFVVSPFYDPPEAENKPARRIWDLIKRTGHPKVTYCTPVTELPEEDALAVQVPASVRDVDLSSHPGARIRFRRLETGDGRPLHAKGLWFTSDAATAYVIGSSNFTSAGLGLSSSPNLEANVVFVASRSRQREAWLKLAKAFPWGPVILLETELRFLTEHSDEDSEATEESPLPEFFLEAVVDAGEEGAQELELRFHGDEPEAWRVAAGDGRRVLLDQRQWREMGRPASWRLRWTDAQLPSGLWVSWRDSVGEAWWPVNVASAAVLPPPDGLRQLPLDVLITILTSARPLHRVLAMHLRDGKKSSDTVTLVDDPHKRVDVHGFILQRTRRVSWALTELRQRLARPVATEDSLAWRIHGPVGIHALADALCREASGEEAAFLVAELALEVRRVRPQGAPGALAVDVVRTALSEAALALADRARQMAAEASLGMRQYLAKVVQEVQA